MKNFKLVCNNCGSSKKISHTLMPIEEQVEKLGYHAHLCESCVSYYYSSVLDDIKIIEKKIIENLPIKEVLS